MSNSVVLLKVKRGREQVVSKAETDKIVLNYSFVIRKGWTCWCPTRGPTTADLLDVCTLDYFLC